MSLENARAFVGTIDKSFRGNLKRLILNDNIKILKQPEPVEEKKLSMKEKKEAAIRAKILRREERLEKKNAKESQEETKKLTEEQLQAQVKREMVSVQWLNLQSKQLNKMKT